MESPVLKAVLSHYIAEKDKVLAELDIYLNHPSSVVEQNKIVEEVISSFEKLEKSYSVIELIQQTIEDNQNSKETQSSQNS